MPILPPPVPEGLRESLKNFPEHIQTLQEDLKKVVSRKHPGQDPFEVAVWMLEGSLGTFISQARAELKVAESSGDVEALASAKSKLATMLDCRPSSTWKLQELLDYFQKVES